MDFLRRVIAGSPYEYIAGAKLGSNAASTGVITLPKTFEFLELRILIEGFSSADIAALQFNSDTSNNYWCRHLTVAAGGTTHTNTQTASTSRIRLSQANITAPQVVVVWIMNQAAISKAMIIETQTATANAGTVGIIDHGAGEWVNTSAQITSVNLLCVGANNLLAGSGIEIFGRDLLPS